MTPAQIMFLVVGYVFIMTVIGASITRKQAKKKKKRNITSETAEILNRIHAREVNRRK